MNIKNLYKALAVFGEVPLGAKEQLALVAIATKKTASSFADLIELIGGEHSALRQLLARLKDKEMIEIGRNDFGVRTYKLSSKGEEIIDRIKSPKPYEKQG